MKKITWQQIFLEGEGHEWFQLKLSIGFETLADSTDNDSLFDFMVRQGFKHFYERLDFSGHQVCELKKMSSKTLSYNVNSYVMRYL